VIEAQVAVVLSREQRPWTLLAQFVTTTGRLDVDRARQRRHEGHGGHLLYPIHFVYLASLASCAPDECTKDRQAAVAGASVWSSCSNFAKRSRSGSSSTSNCGSSRRTSNSWRWASSIVIWLTKLVLIGMPVKTSYGWRIAIK